MKMILRPLTCPFLEFLEYASPDARIFDIGCGSGAFLRILCEYRHPAAVGGAEITRRLIENAERFPADLSLPKELLVYDGQGLPECARSYETFFLIDGLHHIPVAEQGRLLHMLFQILPFGTRLVLKDLAGGNPLLLCNRLHDTVSSGD